MNKDEGTRAETIEQPRRGKRKPVASNTSPGGLTLRQKALVNVYRHAALAAVDIVDLANLPEDDRHLAMQKFALRQLYIPLRMTVDTPTADEQEETTLIAWEQQRDQSRLIAAGRAYEESDSESENKNERPSLGELLAGGSSDTPEPPKKKSKRGKNRASAH